MTCEKWFAAGMMLGAVAWWAGTAVGRWLNARLDRKGGTHG